MMAEHQNTTDDPIGAYAREPPPVFSQVHLPERSRLNTDYLKSLPGILKITTIVSDICILICGLASVVCYRSHSVFVWADIISAFGLVLTTLLLLSYLLRITDTFSLRLPWWRLFEMIYLSAWSFWHLTVGISCAYYADKQCHWVADIIKNPLTTTDPDRYVYKDKGALPAASFFGFLACAAYALDNFFTFAIWKAETRTNTTVANAESNGATTVPT